jgi:hypothetical protein
MGLRYFRISLRQKRAIMALHEKGSCKVMTQMTVIRGIFQLCIDSKDIEEFASKLYENTAKLNDHGAKIAVGHLLNKMRDPKKKNEARVGKKNSPSISKTRHLCRECNKELAILGVLGWCDNCKDHFEV